MNRVGRKSLIGKEIFKSVSITLGLDKNKRQLARLHGIQQIHQCHSFLILGNLQEVLGNQLSHRSDATDAQEKIVVQERGSQILDLLREGSTEHEGSALASDRHIFTLHNSTDLGFETHIQHTVCLVQYQKRNVAQRTATTLQDIDQTTRSRDQDITGTFELTQLVTNRGTTIDDHGAKTGLPAELACLFKDLGGKLAGRCNDQRLGIGAT
mmetsp:Transcript_4307/g.10587  ORF Transcript_4307/g.10587 Transcript_4307/m.10587 type:complete len:211 (-) Transcript_4307:429-1061(-)